MSTDISRPQVVINDDKIFIIGVPAVAPSVLHNSEMVEIIHRIKHLFRDGTRHKAHADDPAKTSTRLNIRGLCVAYSVMFDNDLNLLVISLIRNTVSVPIIKENQKFRKLTPQEIKNYLKEFTQLVATELQEYLDLIFQEALDTNTKPNYYTQLTKTK